MPQLRSVSNYPLCGDYGEWPNNQHIRMARQATGTLSVPVLERGKLRGDASQARSSLRIKARAVAVIFRDRSGADVRDSIRIKARKKQVGSLAQQRPVGGMKL